MLEFPSRDVLQEVNTGSSEWSEMEKINPSLTYTEAMKLLAQA